MWEGFEGFWSGQVGLTRNARGRRGVGVEDGGGEGGEDQVRFPLAAGLGGGGLRTRDCGAGEGRDPERRGGDGACF